MEDLAMLSVFAAAHFSNDETARALIETIPWWPERAVCCGTVNHAYTVKDRAGLYLR
jgi:hypothetical protein